MNIKELKKEIELKIKNEIILFQEQTGLEVNYIDVSKKKPIGFSQNEGIEINIKIKE